MTTTESATLMDNSSADYNTGTEKKKPSLLGKVKAQAKKLKSKLKPGNQVGESRSQNDDNNSVSSSDDEEELGYTPLSNAVNLDDDKTTAHAPSRASASPRDYSSEHQHVDQSDVNLGTDDQVPQEDRKFGLLDSPDQKGRLATKYSSAASASVPSGSTPLSQFKNPGPAGVEQAVPTSYNYYNKDPAAALGLRTDDTQAGGNSAGITPAPSDSRAVGTDTSEAGDRSFSSGQFSLYDNSNRSADGPYAAAEDEDARIPAGISAPRAAAETLSDSSSRQGREDGYDEDSLSSRNYNQDVGRKAPSTKSTDTLAGAEDAADQMSGNNQSYREQQPTDEASLTQKAYDTLVGVKDASADKLGVQSGTSDNISRESRTHTDSFFNSSAAPVSEFNNPTESNSESKPVAQRMEENATSWKDSIASAFGAGGRTTGTDMSQNNDRDLPASTATSTEQKPLTEKLTESVATKLGYEGSSTHTPGEHMTQTAKDRAVNVKNLAADKLGQADVAASYDSTPVSQKAADSVYRAKDSTVSTLTPTEDHKALSQTVTETITSLPALFTEKLGFGGSSSPTTSPSADSTSRTLRRPSEPAVPVSESPSNLSPAAHTPENASAPASPGIVNRVTDAVSSFFGGNKNIPSSSPSASERGDVTDSSEMVTDLDGQNVARSSPAA